MDLTPAPGKRIASIFLAPQCDMACRFCASELGFDAMTFEEALALLAALRPTPITHVVLGGGEPFLWMPGVARLAAAAQGIGFHVQICTNGVPLPEGFEGLPGVDRFILPLESTDPARHDAARIWGAGGHHALVLRRLESLRRAGREVTISTVVTRRNLADLPGLGAFLRNQAEQGLRLHAWHLYRFLPVGRGGAIHGADLAVDPAAYRAACDAEQAAGLPFTVYRRDDMLRASSVAYLWREGGTLRMA
jgi:MoaA/NifB/PqqE/SkfB family radical SAM enzyme